jgi:hypothetical protein
MKEVFECATCGVVSDVSQELCAPRQVGGREDYCGSAGETSEMCRIMLKSLQYECNSCGRPAEAPELICDPRKVH